jgi:ribonuclease BN (tRNA processing enzyme)
VFVRILGSGTIAGQTNRNCSGYLVDDRILLDCGPGTWRSLDSRGIELRLINIVLISHFHVDHISDLIALLWARNVLKIDKEQVFSIFGPSGTRAWYEKLTAVHSDWLHEAQVEIHELSEGGAKTEGYTIKASSTYHTLNSICFRITDSSNRSLFYSGDTGWNENLVKLANSCDLAIIEASVSSENKATDHLSSRLAAVIAQRAEVKRLILTHFYPEALNQDPLAEARKEYEGEITIAQDGLTVVF